jgi:hypothetical protein
MTRVGMGSPRRGSSHESPFDSCWLVVAGTRHGPMPFEMAVEQLNALHTKGVGLSELSIVHARHPLGDKRERAPREEVGARLVGHARHGAARR